MPRSFQTASAASPTGSAAPSRTAAVARLVAVATLGTLCLTACSTGDEASPAGATGGSASVSPTNGTASASSAAAASSSPASSDTAEGPIVPGAANEAWMKQARQAVDDTDPKSTACLDTLLDQTMLDAVATYLPEVASVGLGGLRHEAGCTFSAAGDPGTAPTVQVKRFYLANDSSKTMDEAGLLGSDMCAPDRDQDANGISTDVGDVAVFKGPGGAIRATVRGAWSCSENGAIGSGFLVSAGAEEKDGIPDPDQLAEPDFAMAAATHLHDTEVNWAPTLDDLYEANFRDVLGQ
ncbi:hypothetical protein [Arthrobacter sp. JSM 101049]|uniref:hypothetical protein n=1 Tax=Arthrobacter sp. JSM 101049 TaxID=929097 RepID=UPI003566B157